MVDKDNDFWIMSLCVLLGNSQQEDSFFVLKLEEVSEMQVTLQRPQDVL